MTAKPLFLKDKTLSNQWAAVATSDWFQQVLIFAMNEFIEQEVTDEQIKGAKKFRDCLLELVETPAPAVSFPSSGIHHNVLELAEQLKK